MTDDELFDQWHQSPNGRRAHGNPSSGNRMRAAFCAGLRRARDDAADMTLRLRAADALADAVDEAVQRGSLDSRSKIADARLDYGDPFRREG